MSDMAVPLSGNRNIRDAYGLISVLSNPRAIQEHLQKIDEAQRKLEVTIQLKAKLEEIPSLHEAAQKDREGAAEILASGRQAAKAIEDRASRSAQNTLDMVENRRRQQEEDARDLVQRENSIKERETVVAEKEATLTEREEALTKSEQLAESKAQHADMIVDQIQKKFLRILAIIDEEVAP